MKEPADHRIGKNPVAKALRILGKRIVKAKRGKGSYSRRTKYKLRA